MRRPARRRLVPLVLLLVALPLAACSEDPSSAPASAAPATAQEAGVELPDPAQAATVVTNPVSAPPAGTCSVRVSGAVTTSWDGRQDTAGVAYGPWIAAGGPSTDVSLPVTPDTYFVAACTASGGRSVTFSANGAIPQRPAVYRFHRGTGQAAEGQAPGDLMRLDVSLDGGTPWTAGGDGRLTVTAFDGAHVAGEFDITIAPAGGELATTAQLAGSFDFPNPTRRRG